MNENQKKVMWGLLIALIILAVYILYGDRLSRAPSDTLTPETVEQYYTVPHGSEAIAVDEDTISSYYVTQ